MRNNPSNNMYNILNFCKSESFSGVILIICTVIAIILANFNLSPLYNDVLHKNITIGYKTISLSMSISHWVNDGFMAIFFFVVGMEIKRELIIGELKSMKKTILPIAAALGGMIVPAIIYAVCNSNEPTISGWGIPMATDIAFALGILSLVGREKAPKGIVVILTALAIVDDLGAIIVIAIFYSKEISLFYLLLSLAIVCVLVLANKCKVESVTIFIIIGIVLWVTMLKSGVHATFAGVILGFAIPGSRDEKEFKKSLLNKLEHTITPLSSYFIMPIFALANAGVVFNRSSLSTILSTPVSVGVILGLFLGKQLGIFGTSIVLIKLGIAKLPVGVNKKHLYGASVLAGIGFTMSIFISALSFSDDGILSTAKISIIVASILSSVWGVIVFALTKSETHDVNIE